MNAKQNKTLIVVHSYHHHNTRGVADAMASVLDASVQTTGDFDVSVLQGYNLIGFGAGIDSGKHYPPLDKTC